MIGNIGQKHRNTPVGKYIYDITSQNDVKTILDIGTWNGLGSTKCIYDAIIDSSKKDYYVISLEADILKWQIALENYKGLQSLENFYLIYGRIVSDREQLKYLSSDLISNDVELGWLNEEIKYIKECPYVFNKIPKQIDLLILDGGFAGETEFKKLYERCIYFILDDTKSIKNKVNRQFILDNPNQFKIIEDNLNDQFLICKRI